MDDDPRQSPVRFEISKLSNQWVMADIDFDALLSHWTEQAFNHLNIKGQFEISVVLCDDDHCQQINHTHRKINKPTNVLSFPSKFSHNVKNSLPGYVCPLGDIVLSYSIIQFEANDQDKSFNDHLCHLWIHGLLHLLGYDHEIDAEAIIMESTEINILKLMHINNPYQTADEISAC